MSGLSRTYHGDTATFIQLSTRPKGIPAGFLIWPVLGSLRKAQTIGQDGLRVGVSRLRRSLPSEINWLREDLIALRDPLFKQSFPAKRRTGLRVLIMRKLNCRSHVLERSSKRLPFQDAHGSVMRCHGLDTFNKTGHQTSME